ncbi:hypothetical protein HU200_051656 [Digitaria exilis]|uniref:KIB1-4 beta-propeller domain-containing protein n=1 Tax=Digitaria exilis TaxID=1010633 RepID=A0A835AMK7_9POAL|nr:hypothetical protein HU200_051656 [Digitaria exilis]
MAKHSRSPSSNKTGLSRGAKAKRACVAANPPPPSALAMATTSSSWPVKRARGARRRPRLPVSKRSWAALDYGLAGVIAERALADDVSSYMSFRAVCHEWRRGTEDAPGQPLGCLLDRRFHPRRWIMLREAKPPRRPNRHRRRFLNVATAQCVQTELPELNGHHLLGATVEGLLVLLDKSTYVVRVLNPVTRQLAELPSLDPLLPTETRKTISEYGHAYALKVTGVGLAGDSTIALCFYDPKMLVVARPGDARWTLVDGDRWFYTAMSFQGRFYCVSFHDKAVMALDLNADTANQQPPRLVVAAKLTCRLSLMCRDTVHLVESDGRLLLLRRALSFREELDCHIRSYEVFAVDLAAKETVPVGVGLGGRAVFLGKTRALSVSPLVFPSIRPDRVYPAADIREKRDYGVGSYSILDGSVERCKVRMGATTDEIDGGWERPCDICDYLSWYVSGKCRWLWIQEI